MWAIAVFCPAAYGGVTAWAECNLVAVAPDKPPPATTAVWDGARVALKAARGETESFQLVVRADAARLISIKIFDLVGLRGTLPGGSVATYREVYLPVGTPSPDPDTGFAFGARGRFADPLVPVTGHFDAPGGENVVLWLELTVPPDAAAGRYAGSVLLQWQGGETTFGLDVTVWDFSLTPFGPLAVLADVDPEAIARGFGVDAEGEEGQSLRDKYTNLLLEHRVSPANALAFTPPAIKEEEGEVAVTWGAADASFQRLVLSRGVPRLAAAGPADAASGRWRWRELNETTFRGYLRELDQHYRERGWHVRTYLDFGEDAARYAGLARAEAPDIPVLVRRPLYAADGGNDAVAVATTFAEGDAYEDRRRELAGRGVIIGYDAGILTDYVDRPRLEPRLVGWAVWRYGGSFGALPAWADFRGGGHPLEDDPWRGGGNGVGALVYPGTDAGVNGPLPSIRLKLLREGAEDYEYLQALAAAGLAAYAAELATSVLPAWDDRGAVTPAAVYRAREAAAVAVVKSRWGQGLSGDDVTGVVRDDENLPVPGAVVRAGDLAVTAAPDGRFHLALAPRGVALTAEAPGYERAGATAAGGEWVFSLRRRLRRYLLHDAAAKGTKLKVADFAGGHVAKGTGFAGGPAYAGKLRNGKAARAEFTPPLTDWKTYGAAAVELYNKGPGGVRAVFGVRDADGASFHTLTLLAPGVWKTARLDLTTIADRPPVRAGAAGGTLGPAADVADVKEVYITFEGSAGADVRIGRCWLEK